MNDDVNNQMCRPDGGGIGATAGCGATSKWALVTPALAQVVAATEADVNWGLKFFPDSMATNCAVGTTAAVDVGPGNAAKIAAAIAGATMTNGGAVGYPGTPTRAVAMEAATYMAALTDKRPKYILLATDGAPTCGATDGGIPNATGDDSAAAVTAVAAAHTAGFPTFVVGISTSAAATDMTLTKIANAGGLARAGTPAYYPVANAADLSAAIRTLVGVAATCTFQVGPAPTDDGTTDLEKINVFGDGTEIPRDPNHANGYDYVDATMQSVQVYGPLCDQIMSGTIRDVTVTFRCLVT